MAKTKPRKKAEKAAKSLGGMSGKAARSLMGRRRRVDSIINRAVNGKKKKKSKK